ncbi:helix-turn-helix domain-containing protein [Hahella sp. NBU794]|uniref:helix-turn-helix domain-containing protein n=1 Tax=Hahella sp. NBU794 TaxID=3422590 RepID=UPI003D6E88CF
MRKSFTNSVDLTLSRSSATRLDYLRLNEDLALARWANRQDRVRYQMVGHHTLSIYLRGGTETCRIDAPERCGGPGKICLMPAEHDSTWQVSGPLEFAHLYFSEASFKQMALSLWDMDPRRVELPDLAYADDPELTRLGHIAALQPEGLIGADNLALQQISYEMMAHVLRRYAVFRKPDAAYKGGLAPATKRKVLEYMQAHFGEDLSLERLALVAGLSPFHFARMFKVTMAEAPHQYLRRLRINAARELLAQGVDLAEAALICGFANQSHFTRAFKQMSGVTPGSYRRQTRLP